MGPPLRRRGGHYRFDDDDMNQRELNLVFNLKSQELKQAVMLENIVGDLSRDLTNQASQVSRINRRTRGMSLEDRRALHYILDMNTRLHKLQPYFDLVSAYYWEIMHAEKNKKEEVKRPGKHRSPLGTNRANSTRLQSAMHSQMNETRGSHMTSIQEQINYQLTMD